MSSWNPRPAAAPGDPPRKGGRRVTSRSPRGAAHPGNGVIASFHGGRPRNRGVKDTHRPPFSAPSSRRRPSETAIRTASPALTLKSSQPGTTNRSRLRDGVGRYEPDRRGPDPGRPDPGRPGPACAMRAQRDAVRLTSRRASPARHNPPELDSREPTWRNASPGDITETTPPGAGLSGAHRVGRGPRRPSRRLPPEAGLRRTAQPTRPRTIGSAPPHGLAARTALDRAAARRREAVALLREQHHYSASDTARALGVSRQRVYQLAR